MSQSRMKSSAATLLDLSFLSPTEEALIQKVLLRDEDLNRLETGRTRRLRQSVPDLRQLRFLTGEWFEELKSRRFGHQPHASAVVRSSMRWKKSEGHRSRPGLKSAVQEDGEKIRTRTEGTMVDPRSIHPALSTEVCREHRDEEIIPEESPGESESQPVNHSTQTSHDETVLHQSTKPEPAPAEPGTTRSRQENIPNIYVETKTVNLKAADGGTSTSRNFTVRSFAKALEERQSSWERRRRQADSDPDHAMVPGPGTVQSGKSQGAEQRLQVQERNKAGEELKPASQCVDEDLEELESKRTTRNDPEYTEDLRMVSYGREDPERITDLEAAAVQDLKDLKHGRLEDEITATDPRRTSLMRVGEDLEDLESAPAHDRNDPKLTGFTAEDLSMGLIVREDPEMITDLESAQVPHSGDEETTATDPRRNTKEDSDALDDLEAELVNDLNNLKEGRFDPYAEDPDWAEDLGRGSGEGFGRASPTRTDELSVHEETDLETRSGQDEESRGFSVVEVEVPRGTVDLDEPGTLAGVYARAISPRPKLKESGGAIPTIVIVPSTPEELEYTQSLKTTNLTPEPTPGNQDTREDEGVDSDEESSASSHESEFSSKPDLSASALSITERTGSLMSVYSDAGDFGNVMVQGSVEFAIMYSPLGELVIMVEQCQDLAIANLRKQRTDPYVKTYLHPDKRSKRKTTIKKRTQNPVYVESLRYKVKREELAVRTLNLSVWHNDPRGRNVFLGQVEISLRKWDWKDDKLTWYNLQPKSSDHQDSHENHGVLSVALKHVPAASTDGSKSSRATGEIHIWLREARNLRRLKAPGVDSFVKCYMLPDTSKKSRQKTRVMKRCQDPVFNHTMVYDGFSAGEVSEACCELTVWDNNKLSNQFLGGVRLGLGTGQSYGKKVEWMDSENEETEVWRRMMENPGAWAEAELPLRSSMTPRKRK